MYLEHLTKTSDERGWPFDKHFRFVRHFFTTGVFVVLRLTEYASSEVRCQPSLAVSPDSHLEVATLWTPLNLQPALNMTMTLWLGELKVEMQAYCQAHNKTFF